MVDEHVHSPVRDLRLVLFLRDTAPPEIYTLSLHDALPIRRRRWSHSTATSTPTTARRRTRAPARSEEHTSELQSRQYLVCRLLLEKKKKGGASWCAESRTRMSMASSSRQFASSYVVFRSTT